MNVGVQGATGSEQKISFTDKVLEGAPSIQIKIPDDLMEKHLASLMLKDGDRMLPIVMFDDAIISELAQPWRDSLMI